MIQKTLNLSVPSDITPYFSFHLKLVFSPNLAFTRLTFFQEMLDGIRQRQEFTFDEYQAMLNLQCGVDPANSEVKPRDRNYSMYVIDLHGMEMDKPNSSK